VSCGQRAGHRLHGRARGGGRHRTTGPFPPTAAVVDHRP
jgi:hypothetical protein